MKEWRVYSKPEPGKEKGVIIWWPEWDAREAREWFKENVENQRDGHFYHRATLELVEFETREERMEKAIKELVEAYGEMEKGIDDPVLCHYNSMRLHNAVEDQRALLTPGYSPRYMPSLDDGTDDSRTDTETGK